VIAKRQCSASAAILGLMLTGLCSAQSAAPHQSATVSGAVTSITGGQLSRATVRLAPAPGFPGALSDMGTSNAVTVTGAQGNFSFTDIAPGRYSLTAERIGFLDPPYFEVKLDSGQNKTGIVLEMTPQGIIAGRVVDDANEPLAGADVTISRDSRIGGAERLIPPTLKGTTDADGAFSIGGFSPGRYTIAVTPPLALASPVKPQDPNDPVEAYIKSYYPDATDLASAAAVEIGPGSQVRGLEVQLRRVPVFKITGKVINSATGESGPAEIINLIHEGSATPRQSARSTALVSGEFSFENVPFGNYILETRALEEPGPQPPLVGWQTLSVSNSDLEGIVVEMRPSIELRGRVLVEGAPTSSLPQISLIPIEGLNYLQSPTVDSNGAAVGPGISVFGARAAGQFFGAKTDESGGFSMTNLPPGEYRIIAMETMTPVSPALLSKIGTTVTVDDAASATAEIPLTSAEDVRAARIALTREQ